MVFAIIITNSFENNNVIDMYNSINAFLIFDKKKKFNFLYDTVCDYLDSEFVKNNYCDFKDNICIAKRNHLSKRKGPANSNRRPYSYRTAPKSFHVAPDRCPVM